MSPRRSIAIFYAPFALVASAACAAPSGGDESVGTAGDAVTSSLTDLQTGAWTTCSTSGSNCGGAGGTGTPVQSAFTLVPFAGSTTSARISIGGGISYGTAYWYKKLPAPSYQVATVDYVTDFYLPAGTSYEAIEWDTQQVRAKTVYNFGWQANNTLGQWRIFDYAAGRWEDSGIPWTGLTQGAWHSFHAHYRTSGSTVYADGFELDGVAYATRTNGSHAAVPKPSYTNDDISVGLQLDQAKSGQSYAVYYDHVRLDYSDGNGGTTSSNSSSGGSSCAAPSLLEPTAGQSVGPAIHLRTSAPSCIVATKCYLDGNPAPVATLTAPGDITQWAAMTMGAHHLACNGWDAAGAVHISPSIAFTRTY